MGMYACVDTGNSKVWEMKVSGLLGDAIWSCFPNMRYQSNDPFYKGCIDCDGIIALTPAMCALVSQWMLFQLASSKHELHRNDDHHRWYWMQNVMDATYLRIAADHGLTVVFG
jgi:hypothetical protein